MEYLLAGRQAGAQAGMMELADMLALGASARKSVGVQISLPAQINYSKGFLSSGEGGGAL